MKKLLSLVLSLLLLAGCAAEEQQTAPEYDWSVIALLDTGVSTAAIGGENLLAGHNYVTDTSDTEDRINHGTAVASVILGCESAGVTGLAEDACYIVPLVVADEGGSVTPEVLAQVIRESIDTYGADIINISLGIRKDAEVLDSYRVRSTDIDVAHHMNNALYIRAFFGALSCEELRGMSIREVDVMFRSPSFEGEVLTICRRKTEEGFEIGILHADGKAAVVARVLC